MKDKELEKRLAELESCVAKMQDYNGRLNHLEHDIEICKRVQEGQLQLEMLRGKIAMRKFVQEEMKESKLNDNKLEALNKYRAYRDLKFSDRVALAKEYREHLKRESEKYNFTIEDSTENFMAFLQNKFNEFDEKESLCLR